MRVSLLFLVFVTALLSLAFGEEAVADEKQRKSLWSRIAGPVGGLYRKGKNAIGGARKSVGDQAKKAADDTAGQKSKLEEGIDAVMGALDELAAEGEASVHAAKDAAHPAAASVEDQMAAGVDKVAAAGASIQKAVDDGSEAASKEADAVVEAMDGLKKQAADAADQAKAAVGEEAQQAAAAGEEL